MLAWRSINLCCKEGISFIVKSNGNQKILIALFYFCNTLVAVKHRICCAETVIKRLDKRVFRRRNIDAKLKGHFTDSAVFASLLYGLEHCAFGPRDQRCLDCFFLGLAKRVLHLPFDYHLSYVEAEQSLGVTRPSTRLRRERLRWTGHMLRSEDTVLYEALIFIPDGGARGRGRQRRRYYDTIKADLAERNVILDHRGQEQFGKASPQSKRPSSLEQNCGKWGALGWA